MKTENNTPQVKYPENRDVRSKLLPGDRTLIVEYSGYSRQSINGMLDGTRRLTDKAKVAIVRVLKDREDLNSSFKEIVSTSTSTGPETKPASDTDARTGSGGIPCAFE